MARGPKLCALIEGRFELTLYAPASHSGAGRQSYEASLNYSFERFGRRAGELPCSERELPDLAGKMVRHLARDGFRYGGRPTLGDIQSLHSLGEAMKDLVDNYLRRGQSVETWQRERGLERIEEPRDEQGPRPRL